MDNYFYEKQLQNLFEECVTVGSIQSAMLVQITNSSPCDDQTPDILKQEGKSDLQAIEFQFEKLKSQFTQNTQINVVCLP